MDYLLNLVPAYQWRAQHPPQTITTGLAVPRPPQRDTVQICCGEQHFNEANSENFQYRQNVGLKEISLNKNRKSKTRTEQLQSKQQLRILWNGHGWYTVTIESVLNKNKQGATVLVRGHENGNEFQSKIKLYSKNSKFPVWSNVTLNSEFPSQSFL